MINTTLRALVVSLMLIMSFISNSYADFYVIPVAKNYMYWQGDWVQNFAYKIGDGVQFEGSSYVCINAHQSAFDNYPLSENWNLLAAKGASGADSTVAGPIGPEGPSGADSMVPGPIGPEGPPGPIAGTNGQFIYNNNGSAAGSNVYSQNGRVGIANADPFYSLDVEGSIRATLGIKVTGDGQIQNQKRGTEPYIDAAFTGFWWGLRSDSQRNIPFNIDYLGAVDNIPVWETALSINRSGDIGIGTIYPSEKLDVVGNIDVSGTVDGRDVATDGTKLDTISSDAEDTTNDSWAGTGNVYTTSGRVGIGTAVPSAKLHIKGPGYPDSFIHIDTNSLSQDSGIQLREGTNTRWHIFNDGANSDKLRIAPEGSYATGGFTLLQSGYIGVNTNYPTYRLYVNGTAYATGAAGSLSDRRHKENISDLSINALQIVKKLRPVAFQWKEPQDNGMEGIQLGFIAQEVESVLPEAILTQDNEEQTKGLKYSTLIPVLTKAINELEEENTVLSNIIHELQALACLDHPDASICQN